jgi:heme a synthase
VRSPRSATRSFPSSTLTEALQADLSASSHLLIRLRVLHPVLAVAAAFAVAVFSARLARGRDGFAPRAARAVTGLLVLQVGLGLLNVALLAPVWLQLVHLAVADAIWIGFVLLGADVLAEPSVAVTARAA